MGRSLLCNLDFLLGFAHPAFIPRFHKKAEEISVKGLNVFFFFFGKDRQVRGSGIFFTLWVSRTKINGKERFYFYTLEALALGQKNSQSGCLVLSIQLRPGLSLSFCALKKINWGAEQVGRKEVAGGRGACLPIKGPWMWNSSGNKKANRLRDQKKLRPNLASRLAFCRTLSKGCKSWAFRFPIWTMGILETTLCVRTIQCNPVHDAKNKASDTEWTRNIWLDQHLEHTWTTLKGKTAPLSKSTAQVEPRRQKPSLPTLPVILRFVQINDAKMSQDRIKSTLFLLNIFLFLSQEVWANLNHYTNKMRNELFKEAHKGWESMHKWLKLMCLWS